MQADYLWKKLGSDIQMGLMHQDVTEIMLNPDSKLWFSHRKKGQLCIGEMSESKALSFVHALAQSEEAYLNSDKPYLDATLPFHGERVNITMPPISKKVSFNIRKKSKIIFSLEDYVNQGILHVNGYLKIITALQQRQNVLISGGPGAGKTTFTNAILNEMVGCLPEGHRIITLEQIPELQCNLPNWKSLITTDLVDMRRLLWLSMRCTPDSIVIGEVRDGCAYSMLKAWSTGTGPGVATIHANTPASALQRVIDLSCEATSIAPYPLVAEAIDLVIQIDAKGNKRLITGMLELKGYDRQSGCYDLVHFNEKGEEVMDENKS